MSRIFITEVNAKLNEKIWETYKKVDFVGSFNPKFRGSKAEKLLIDEYKRALTPLMQNKYKKVIVKHNDLNISINIIQPSFH